MSSDSINLDIDLDIPPLQVTIAPWRIGPDHSGELTKKFAMTGKVSQYAYNTGHDTSEWRADWQRGYVCSPGSGRIVLDADEPEAFAALLERCGIPASPVKVLTGRPGGFQLHYDGRSLAYGDWPVQRGLYAPDGAKAGDVKSHGFVPVPGSIHPNGTRYAMAPGSGGLGDELAWDPAWTQALIADQEGLGRHCYGVNRGATGAGRNNELYALKKRLFYDEQLDEDDPELIRRIFEANEEFAEPLHEREVQHTVLRRKGFKRHGHFNPEPMEYADEDTCDGTGQPDVPAGSEILGREEDLEEVIQAHRYVKKLADLRRPSAPQRLDTVRRVEAKLKAEADPHPWSLDWAGAPEGTRDLYEDLGEAGIESLKAGAELAQVDWAEPGGAVTRPAYALSGPWREQMQWLLHGNGAPLIEYHGGLIYLLSDPVTAEKAGIPASRPASTPRPARAWAPG